MSAGKKGGEDAEEGRGRVSGRGRGHTLNPDSYDTLATMTVSKPGTFKIINSMNGFLTNWPSVTKHSLQL